MAGDGFDPLSSCVRLGLDQPEALGRVLAAATELNTGSDLPTLADRVLAHAMSVTAADFGNVQLLDPASGALRIVAHSGFDTEFLEYFSAVDDTASACGRAVRESKQIAIADVRTDAAFAPHRDIATAAGFRGVQSTPLLNHAGRLVGMVSTHFGSPHRPPQPELELLRLYGVFAGEVTARLLANGDPASPQLASARVFDPRPPRLRPVYTGSELGARLDGIAATLSQALHRTGDRVTREHLHRASDELVDVIARVRHLWSEGAHEHCDTLAFAVLGERLVRALFDGGLRLGRIRATLDGETLTPTEISTAREALDQAVDDLDAMIRDTGLAMLTLTSTVPATELPRRRRRR
ncbi:GAF domain-containing protein [Nocardia sp. NPDC051832]|uniref:GAF domain-containing protein n=1 Tax=Nocardia sp. NPDC051832 TaxID=3155673 RepID=UPI003430F033